MLSLRSLFIRANELKEDTSHHNGKGWEQDAYEHASHFWVCVVVCMQNTMSLGVKASETERKDRGEGKLGIERARRWGRRQKKREGSDPIENAEQRLASERKTLSRATSSGFGQGGLRTRHKE